MTIKNIKNAEMDLSSRWKVVIGLEIHAQLLTKSKMFSRDATDFHSSPNTNTNEVSLGLPGALPSVNKQAIELGVRLGHALHCTINTESVFSRKNYFYPDLPKGYQISQYDQPLCKNGWAEILSNEGAKKIRIERAHLEEDAGKSIHKGQHTLVDCNRAGIPLIEIVSEPDLSTPQEAAEYARTIRQLLRYAEVSDGNLQEGSMRCDCNISLCAPHEKWGTKVEIKNINSFKFIEKALLFEIKRQAALLEGGETIFQETRLYNIQKDCTELMRRKEEAHDYRYFSDPDLPPLILTKDYIQNIKDGLPELPKEKMDRFQKDYRLSAYDAKVLCQDINLANYFEQVVLQVKDAKLVSNWLTGEVLGWLQKNKKILSDLPFSKEEITELFLLIKGRTLSGKMAKIVFKEMCEGSVKSPSAIVKEKGLKQITDEEEIKKIVQSVLDQNLKQKEDYKQGKHKLFGFFVGQIMKVSKGQVCPELLNKILKKELE